LSPLLDLWSAETKTVKSFPGSKFPANNRLIKLKISVLTRMPMLSALDLIETRGLPRRISLLSEIEAQTLDRSEQDEGIFRETTHSQSWNGIRIRRQSTAKDPGAWAIAISAMVQLRGEALLSAQQSARFQVPYLVSPSHASCAGNKSRRISLLSRIEAETDSVEQNVSESTEDGTACNITSWRRHSRTWNGGSSIVLRRHLLLAFAFIQTGS